MASADLIDDYVQVGNGTPTDSFQPGDGKQLIDLTEFHNDEEQDADRAIIQGFEELSLGVLSVKTARMLKLKNINNYDPTPSKFNARLGCEGFFSTVMDGFKDIVEKAIKYIRMAIEWVFNLGKQVLGIRKSNRITKAVSDNISELEREFQKTLTGLGFPIGEFSLEKYLGSLPKDQVRKAQLTMMVSKLNEDELNITGLTKVLPLLTECIKELKVAGDLANRKTADLKRAISVEYKKMLVNKGSTPSDSYTSTETNILVRACLEVDVVLTVPKVHEKMKTMFEELYQVKFTNEELETGFSSIRKKLDESVTAKVVQLDQTNIPTTLTNIQYLNARYQEIKDNDVDISSVDWKKLGNAINKDDMDKIKEIVDTYPMSSNGMVNNPLLSTYIKTTTNLKTYTNLCYLISRELNIVFTQINNLIKWHSRSSLFYQSTVLSDFQKMIEIVKQAKDEGLSPHATANNIPMMSIKFFNETQKETFLEHASEHIEAIVKMDVLDLNKRIKKTASQLGFGGV